MKLPNDIAETLRKTNPDLLNRVENALTEAETLNPRVEKTLTASESAQLMDLQSQIAGEITAQARASLVTQCLKLRGLDNLFHSRSAVKA